MISLQEIARWRSRAPWSNDLMVEQDFLISQAVAAIFEDPFLKGQLAMRGHPKTPLRSSARCSCRICDPYALSHRANAWAVEVFGRAFFP